MIKVLIIIIIIIIKGFNWCFNDNQKRNNNANDFNENNGCKNNNKNDDSRYNGFIKSYK